MRVLLHRITTFKPRCDVICPDLPDHVVPNWATYKYVRFTLYITDPAPMILFRVCILHLTFYVSKSFSPVLGIFCFHSLSDRFACGVKPKRALAQPQLVFLDEIIDRNKAA